MQSSSRQDHDRPVPTRGLSVHVTVDAHDVVTVHAAGNLDIYTIARLRQRMARHDLSDGRVILDVSDVTLIDSSGLGTLLSFANRARRTGSRLPLICRPDLADALGIARLSDAFDLTIVAAK
jgi:anti-anti-sigma factor